MQARFRSDDVADFDLNVSEPLPGVIEIDSRTYRLSSEITTGNGEGPVIALYDEVTKAVYEEIALEGSERYLATPTVLTCAWSDTSGTWE